MAAWPEPDNGDMLRTLAVARLLLRDMNIQAPPNLTDPTTSACSRRASTTGAAFRR